MEILCKSSVYDNRKIVFLFHDSTFKVVFSFSSFFFAGGFFGFRRPHRRTAGTHGKTAGQSEVIDAALSNSAPQTPGRQVEAGRHWFV